LVSSDPIVITYPTVPDAVTFNDDGGSTNLTIGQNSGTQLTFKSAGSPLLQITANDTDNIIYTTNRPLKITTETTSDNEIVMTYGLVELAANLYLRAGNEAAGAISCSKYTNHSANIPLAFRYDDTDTMTLDGAGVIVTGSVRAYGFTGSLAGTASYASYALFAENSNATSTATSIGSDIIDDIWTYAGF
jgi:hypothetical protein